MMLHTRNTFLFYSYTSIKLNKDRILFKKTVENKYEEKDAREVRAVTIWGCIWGFDPLQHSQEISDVFYNIRCLLLSREGCLSLWVETNMGHIVKPHLKIKNRHCLITDTINSTYPHLSQANIYLHWCQDFLVATVDYVSLILGICHLRERSL